jgi:hypothetical protein
MRRRPQPNSLCRLQHLHRRLRARDAEQRVGFLSFGFAADGASVTLNNAVSDSTVAFSAGGDGGRKPHDDLERWCGGWALPWHRADLGFVGAHALSRCARVARMDSCGPLLATHFLLERQVEARTHGASGTNELIVSGSDQSFRNSLRYRSAYS